MTHGHASEFPERLSSCNAMTTRRVDDRERLECVPLVRLVRFVRLVRLVRLVRTAHTQTPCRPFAVLRSTSSVHTDKHGTHAGSVRAIACAMLSVYACKYWSACNGSEFRTHTQAVGVRANTRTHATAQSSGSRAVDDTRNGWHHDQRRAMIQTECNGWSAYAANIFNASRRSSGSRARR